MPELRVDERALPDVGVVIFDVVVFRTIGGAIGGMVGSSLTFASVTHLPLLSLLAVARG
ncbi:MAG: hypothetical protein KF773_20540 [Deltaproteobacteria bacterium]|nr:hypothetical protein [Deltaproteobacteria bacterium]